MATKTEPATKRVAVSSLTAGDVVLGLMKDFTVASCATAGGVTTMRFTDGSIDLYPDAVRVHVAVSL